MIFASCGAKLLESSLATARRRMFLFSDDVEMPSDANLESVMRLINKARSFSHTVADSKMVCTRGAGFKSNRYYYTMIDNLVWNNEVIPTSNGTAYQSAVSLFLRWYSVGAVTNNETPHLDSGSVIDILREPGYQAPPRSVMLMPCFDEAVTESMFTTNKVQNQANESVSLSQSMSGTIGAGLGTWYSTTYTYLTSITVKINEFKDATTDATVSVSVGGSMSGWGANTLQTLSSGNGSAYGSGPRLIYGWNKNTYTRVYNSGSGSGSTDTYYAGGYRVTTNVDEVNRYFGTITHEDTPAYKIKFGLLPIAFDKKSPCVVQVLREGTDFTHNGSVSATQIPDIDVAPITDIVIPKTYLL